MSLDYEIKASSIQGFGLIAIRDIPKGSVLVSAKPLLTLQTLWPCDIAEAFGGYNALSPADREAFDSLRRVFDTKRVQDYMTRAVMASRTIPWEQKQRAVEIANKFDSNAVNLQAIDSKGPKAGVFNSDINRINHSCVPNAFTYWDETTGLHEVRTATDIKAGEEIVLSYVPLFKPKKERQQQLKDMYAVACTCEACNVGSDSYRQREWRRSRISQLESGMADLDADIQDPEGEIQRREEHLRLVGEEALGDWWMFRWHAELARLLNKQHQRNKAVEEMQKAADTAQEYLGADSSLTQDYELELLELQNDMDETG